VQGLENDTFDVGASSDPVKFSKSLQNIENYIQKTYKDPDDMVKTIQKMKKVSLSYPERPKKTDPDCCDSNGKGLTICHKNEFVQSRFSDGFLNCPV